MSTVMRFLPAFMAALKSTKNGNSNKAGDRSTEEWEGRMREIAREANEDMIADIRNLLTARNEKIREIIRDELETSRRKRFRSD